MINKLSRWSAALTLGAVLGLASGCAPSNESTADLKGEEPKAGLSGEGAPPKSQEDYAKQQATGGNPYQGQSYPGR